MTPHDLHASREQFTAARSDCSQPTEHARWFRRARLIIGTRNGYFNLVWPGVPVEHPRFREKHWCQFQRSAYEGPARCCPLKLTAGNVNQCPHLNEAPVLNSVLNPQDLGHVMDWCVYPWRARSVELPKERQREMFQ